MRFTRHHLARPSKELRKAVKHALQKTSRLCSISGLHRPRVFYYHKRHNATASYFFTSGNWPVLSVNTRWYNKEYLGDELREQTTIMMVHELIHAVLTMLQVDRGRQTTKKAEKNIELLALGYHDKKLTAHGLARKLLVWARRLRGEKP